MFNYHSEEEDSDPYAVDLSVPPPSPPPPRENTLERFLGITTSGVSLHKHNHEKNIIETSSEEYNYESEEF